MILPHYHDKMMVALSLVNAETASTVNILCSLASAQAIQPAFGIFFFNFFASGSSFSASACKSQESLNGSFA